MGVVVQQKHIVTDDDGHQTEERRKVEAFLVHLGGNLGDDRAFGRKARGVKVLANELGPYVEALIRRYRQQRAEDETFARFIARLSDAELKVFGAKPVFKNLSPAPSIVAEPRAEM
jgi:sulfite reductase (ferredoxin)